MIMAHASVGGTTTPPDLLGSLLYAVSHDLKSPLLTISLGQELLTGSLRPESEPARMALESLQHGIRDLERLLDAVTRLSRAYHREVRSDPVPLTQLLSGQAVITEEIMDRLATPIDPRSLVEALGRLGHEAPERLHLCLAIEADDAVLTLTLPSTTPRPDEEGPTPLELLSGSLHTYAGTAIEHLAVLQLQLERQGGGVCLRGADALIRLPLAGREQ
jgi:signal transduction histidine kinase